MNKLYKQLNNCQSSTSKSNFDFNDPLVKQVMNLIKSNGGDAKSLFFQLAKQKGIDPNSILSQLK